MSKGPDVRQIPLNELEKGAFAGAATEAYRIALAEAAHAAILQHAAEKRDVEVCGVLVGCVLRDDGGPFLDVDATIRGEHAASQGAQVTFTHETWNHIHNEMDRKHPNRRIVGWYHTHPGFGIFLSDFDLFIHQNFFNAPSQVAFVVDPHSGEEGFFCWREGKASRVAHFWVGRSMRCGRPEHEDVRRPARAAGEEPAEREAREAAPRGAGAPPVPAGESSDSDRISFSGMAGMISWAVLLLGLAALGYLMGMAHGRRDADAVVSDAFERRARDMVRMEILHTGLAKEFESMEKALQEAAARIGEGPPGAPVLAAVPVEQVRKTFDQVRERLAAMRQRYETLDRLAVDAMRRGDQSLEDLDREVKRLKGDLLDVRRAVAEQMLIPARMLLDESKMMDEARARTVRQKAEEFYRRALALIPEDRARMEQIFPEFAPPPAESGKPGPGAAPPKDGR